MMRVYFVTDTRRIEEEMFKVDTGSLLLIGHEVGTHIDLVSELDGITDNMRRLSEYARRKNLVIFCGTRAHIYRREYLSIMVIDRGKILGTSDATHESLVGDTFNLGSSYRVYDTSLGMVGVVVGSDIYYPETIRTLARQNIGYIVGLAGEIREKHSEMILKTHSYLNGISILSIVDSIGRVTDREGELTFKTDKKNKMCDIIVSRDNIFIKGLRNDIYDNVYIER